MMKEDTFKSRQDHARDAKQKLLERFRTIASDPAVEQRKVENAAISKARDERLVAKAAEQRRVAEAKAAEDARIKAEREAEELRLAEEKAADVARIEAERIAARPKIITASKYALAARAISGMNAPRGERDKNRKTA